MLWSPYLPLPPLFCDRVPWLRSTGGWALLAYWRHWLRCEQFISHLCIDSAHVVPGDIVILDLGKRISADVRLIETQDLQCGEMALTGMRLIRAALSTRREPYRV